jgi:predicted nucleotidyltransferase
MKFGLPDHILHAIIRELHKREKITRAVIFGSRASNDYKYNSDIDLAVYCEGKLPPGLWVDLDEAAGIYKIDVVDINSNLDEKLRRRIEEQGVEVYKRR